MVLVLRSNVIILIVVLFAESPWAMPANQSETATGVVDQLQEALNNAYEKVVSFGEEVQKSFQRATDSLAKLRAIFRQVVTLVGGPESEPLVSTTERSIPTSERPIPTTEQPNYRDCAEIYSSGERKTGAYLLTPDGLEKSFQAWCDMETDGGGWTVFQKRGHFGKPEDYFDKTWEEFKEGFGELDKEFWLGNDRLSALTLQGDYQLRVDLWEMTSGKRQFVKYDLFKVENEASGYKLTIGNFSGSIYDGLSYNNGMKFTTKDRKNDSWKESESCAVHHRAAWWHRNCSYSNLNGLNLKTRKQPYDSTAFLWYTQHGSHLQLSASELKLRPRK